MKTSEGASKGTMYSWGFGMKRRAEHDQMMPNGPRRQRHVGKGRDDPYEFDDDNHGNHFMMGKELRGMS
jgi:hypothetical protein